MKHIIFFTLSLILVEFSHAAYADTETYGPELPAFYAVSDTELEDNRGTGGFDPDVLNTAQLSATNAGNTITSTNSETGSNFISDDAFRNSSGVISVIQNSGNGVVIQNSTIVNLSMY